jgi:hypothetical protein
MHYLAAIDSGRGIEKSWGEDFVKSFKEGSKVTITLRGENRSGRFLEIAVYAMGGCRGLILFPEGCDGRGWSHVSGELSKALAFLGATDGSPSFGGPPAGNKLGKEAGLSSFAEVVRFAATVSVMGCRPLGQTSGLRGVAEVEEAQPMVEWCELAKLLPLGLEMEVIWQVVDCFALEKQTFGPLVKNLRVDDRFSARDFRCSSACVSRDAKVEVDTSMLGECGAFKKFLKLFGRFSKALDWVCGFSKH